MPPAFQAQIASPMLRPGSLPLFLANVSAKMLHLLAEQHDKYPEQVHCNCIFNCHQQHVSAYQYLGSPNTRIIMKTVAPVGIHRFIVHWI